MSVIDMHGHLGTWPNFMIPEPGADWLVRTMTAVGIDTVGISHLDAIGWDTRAGNVLALEAAEAHPGRIGVWIVADPHDPQAPAVARDLLAHDAVWGFKLHPNVQRCAADDPRYEPFLAMASEAGTPVLVHGEHGAEFSDLALMSAIAERFPDVAILVGHAGLWQEGYLRAAAMAAVQPNLHLEIGTSRMTTRWLERLVAEAGASKVVFGTDACFLDPRIGLGKVHHAHLSDADRSLVLGGNAARLLGDRTP